MAAALLEEQEQTHSPGADKGNNQFYSPVVNLAEAAASILLCGLDVVSPSC